jgi:hypothetical protein
VEDRDVKRSALALSAGILMLALLPGSAMAVAVVDQSNNPSGTPAPTIGTPGDIAQTFTAGKTGLLTEVDLYMNGTGTYPVRIETTTGAGLPAADDLGSGSGTPVNAAGWVPFILGSPVAVIAGHVYAIVFNTGNTAAAWGSGDTYAGGQALIVNGTWMPMQAWLPSSALYDFAFKTFVDPQTTKLQWDKSQVVAGSSTPLTLTETVVFPASQALAAVVAVKPDVFFGQAWSVKSDALPGWFTVTGVTCSAQIATADCTPANVAPGSGLSVTPDGNPITLALTGTASPALAAVGTGTGKAEGCVDYNEMVADVAPAVIVTSCVADQVTVAVVAPGATSAPTTTLPPTTTGGSPSSKEPGPAIWLLPLGLMGLLGGALLLANRQLRRLW